jgi:hypothetical protein
MSGVDSIATIAEFPFVLNPRTDLLRAIARALWADAGSTQFKERTTISYPDGVL